MKKIQIIIYILFTLLSIGLVGNAIISVLAIVFETDILNNSYSTEKSPLIIVKIVALLKLLGIVLFCCAIYFLIKILHLFTEKNYFSDKQVRLFKRSGKFFIFSGLIGFVCSLLPLVMIISKSIEFQSFSYLNYDSKALYLVFIIIGLIFIALSKVVNKGSVLKIENDLTI